MVKILEAAAAANMQHGPFMIMVSVRSFPVFFADIFKNNSINVGILPVQVSEEFLTKIFNAIEADPNTEFEINLANQTITILATGEQQSFDINGYKKHNLMNGFDDIDYLQSMKEDIKSFAEKSLY